MDHPILSRKTLRNYSIIDKPTTVKCEVAATVRPDHLINGTKPYYVVYLRVIEQKKLNRLLTKLDDEPYLDFYTHREFFKSGIVFDNQIKEGYDLPSKGETVIATFMRKYDGLKVKSIELLPRYQLKRVDIHDVYPLLTLFKTYLDGN